MTKFAVIKTQYGGTYADGKHFSAGTVVVMLPRAEYVSTTSAGKKSFKNIYLRLTDLQNYPEYADVRQAIRERYNVDPDTWTGIKKTMRK